MEEKGSSNPFILEVVTPYKKYLEEEVYVVLLPAAKGYLSAMKGHLPLISSIKPGILEFIGKKRNLSLFVEGGFVQILPQKVTLLAERVESIEELDIDKVRSLKADAEEKLKTATDKDKDIFIKYEEAASKLYILEKRHFVL
ncbi:MAG: ATP synthase F1 subunit epsilon [Thermoanaerobaculaceae bacterium]|nr:ATP synthase F1 subunit epsilon [Thermoanaerobaculaceae bacterium]